MKPCKSIIFIDGSNFRFSLRRVGYAERDIHWFNLFNHLVKSSDQECSFWRAHWYTVGKLGDLILFPSQLQRKCPTDKTVDDFRCECETWYLEKEQLLRKKNQDVFGRIAETFPQIHFKYVGVQKVDSISRRYLNNGEKGVDVALAIDLADPSADFDTAIIISGDYDFHPAIEKAKMQMKRVVLAPFVSGDPMRFEEGAARGLRRLADNLVPIYESELNDPKNEFLIDLSVYRPCFKLRGKKRISLEAKIKQDEGAGEWEGSIVRIETKDLCDEAAYQFVLDQQSKGISRHECIRSLYTKLRKEFSDRSLLHR